MSDSESRGQSCICCRKPLTLVKRSETMPDPATGKPITVVMESWDCTDPDCLTMTLKMTKIPTPPLQK